MNVIDIQGGIRREVKTLVSRIPLPLRQEMDLRIRQRLFGFSVYTASLRVCYFLSKNDEVDTKESVSGELARGVKTIVCPRIHGNTLEVCRILSFNELTEGTYGILEPKPTIPPYPVCDIDCCIIPGVAFDRHGGRIGRGRGYYDRFLSSCSAVTIGIAYECQVVKPFPKNSWDISVRYIVTERTIYDAREFASIHTGAAYS